MRTGSHLWWLSSTTYKGRMGDKPVAPLQKLSGWRSTVLRWHSILQWQTTVTLVSTWRSSCLAIRPSSMTNSSQEVTVVCHQATYENSNTISEWERGAAMCATLFHTDHQCWLPAVKADTIMGKERAARINLPPSEGLPQYSRNSRPLRGQSTVYLFDEHIGPKNTDHTMSFLTHYWHTISQQQPWIHRLAIFLDTATSTNKNKYLFLGDGDGEHWRSS